MLIKLNEIFNFIFKRVKKTKTVKSDLENSNNDLVKQICENVLLGRKLILIVPIAYIVASLVYIFTDTEVFINTSKMFLDNILYVFIYLAVIIFGSIFLMFVFLTLLVDKEKREIIKNLFTYLPIVLIVSVIIYIYSSASDKGSYLLMVYLIISSFFVFMNIANNVLTVKYSQMLNEDIKILEKSKKSLTTLIILLIASFVFFAPFWFILFINIISKF